MPVRRRIWTSVLNPASNSFLSPSVLTRINWVVDFDDRVKESRKEKEGTTPRTETSLFTLLPTLLSTETGQDTTEVKDTAYLVTTSGNFHFGPARRDLGPFPRRKTKENPVAQNDQTSDRLNIILPRPPLSLYPFFILP